MDNPAPTWLSKVVPPLREAHSIWSSPEFQTGLANSFGQPDRRQFLISLYHALTSNPQNIAQGPGMARKVTTVASYLPWLLYGLRQFFKKGSEWSTKPVFGPWSGAYPESDLSARSGSFDKLIKRPLFGLGNVPALSEAKGRAMWTKFGSEGTTNQSTADNTSVWQQLLSGLNAATGYIPPAASVTGAGLLGLSGHPILGSITGLLSHDLKGIWNNPGIKDKLLAAIWPAAGLTAPWLAYALRQLFSKDVEKKGADATPTTTGTTTSLQDRIDNLIKGLHEWW